MLSANYLSELPLELRIYIANMDKETYIRMWCWDFEFRSYAAGAIELFIEQFVATKISKCILYKLGDIIYCKGNDGTKSWYINNDLHNPNSSVSANYCNNIQYHINGTLHRTDGPAVIYYNGEKNYYNNGKLHRLDGPAVIYPWGGGEYCVDGKLHRLDGPAIFHPCGYREYRVNGKLHRLDGPAIIYSNGDEEYWQNGVRM